MRYILLFACMALTITLTSSIVADIVETQTTEASEDSDALQLDILAVADEEISIDGNNTVVSVPEPATFGAISLALAVGGGLLIRRRA